MAHHDAAAATAAMAVDPAAAPALQVVAAERTDHANALQAEVARAAGKYPDGSIPEPDASTTSTATPAPSPPPDVNAVKADLAQSQRAASDLARTLSGYRAGLLGSISAACAVHQVVLLG